MKLFFKNRNKLRAAKASTGKKVDLGSDSPKGKRWAIDYKAK